MVNLNLQSFARSHAPLAQDEALHQSKMMISIDFFEIFFLARLISTEMKMGYPMVTAHADEISHWAEPRPVYCSRDKLEKPMEFFHYVEKALKKICFSFRSS